MKPNPASPRHRLALPALFAAALALASCGADLDRLYALPLDREPGEAQWAAAVPYRTTARGGRTSQRGDKDVDADSVHRATASCHHGSGAPPVKVEIRAFHTPERLYLRVTWSDPTPDAGRDWRWEDGMWIPGGEREDAAGLLWGADGNFDCMRACHLKDWRMAGISGLADFKMETDPGETMDFWIWRAGRAAPGGSAEDVVLTERGREADGPPGEFDLPNSVRSLSEPAQAYAPGDAPLDGPPPSPGAWAAGRRVVARHPGRTDVRGEGRREGGRWVLTLSRALQGSDPADAAWTPGGEYLFGLALLDGVPLDHNAVRTPIRLTLVTPAETGRLKGE